MSKDYGSSNSNVFRNKRERYKKERSERMEDERKGVKVSIEVNGEAQLGNKPDCFTVTHLKLKVQRKHLRNISM